MISLGDLGHTTINCWQSIYDFHSFILLLAPVSSELTDYAARDTLG